MIIRGSLRHPHGSTKSHEHVWLEFHMSKGEICLFECAGDPHHLRHSSHAFSTWHPKKSLSANPSKSPRSMIKLEVFRMSESGKSEALKRFFALEVQMMARGKLIDIGDQRIRHTQHFLEAMREHVLPMLVLPTELVMEAVDYDKAIRAAYATDRHQRSRVERSRSALRNFLLVHSAPLGQHL